MVKYNVLFAVTIALSLAVASALPSPTAADDDDDEDETTQQSRADADDDGRIYKNPRNSPSAQCPRDEEQATLLGQKCLRKCSSDEDCKSKKKKCLCDGACGMSCIKPDRECPELTQPEIGKVTLTGRLFGDKAVYSCPHGYHVVGLQSRSCQADGKWAGQPPACKENIYCLQPPTIEHARHSALPEQATFDLDATVQYNCHTGYVTNGFPRAKCLAIDGQASWYGPDISCEPRSCGEPGDVPHGWVTADCHTFGCRAVVQCGQGFELVGKAERYCQADGAWAPKELPTCVLVTQVQCPPPEAPRHGKAVYTSCAYNSVVSYECKYGYRLVGDATRRCGADKKWSGGQPMCKEINCGHPGQLWNGWLENISSGTGLGASIIFRCQDGMKMEGNGSAICQSDGTWSHPLPMCLAPCVVPHVSQGRVVLVENKTGDNTTQEANTQIVGSSTMVQHGEIIVVDCEKDFEFPSSNAAVTCNNGTWTQIPRCQPARCKKMPKFPRNGMVIAPKTEHGMKARFRCKDGFELKGNPIVVCSYGVWSGDTPKCEEVFCPFPGYIENGKVLLVGNMGLYDYRPYVKKVVNNKQIMYECEKGYVLSEGPPGATCVGGHWSPRELPKCTLYQHPRIRWSRRRRSIPEPQPEVRHRRSAYRQYYNNQHHQSDPSQQYLDHLYEKYNHGTSKPTLRHANFKIMKKFDFEEELEPPTSAEKNDENFPTAVYTIYNIHGEPVGHRLYSYQPVYEPEEDDIIHHEETSEYENSDEGDDELEHMTVLKGGMFGDHSLSTDSNADNINKLKHEYFERYVDKRRKRFLNKNLDDTKKGVETSVEDETDFDHEGSDEKKEVDLELEGEESKIDTVTQLPPQITTKTRIKRGINNEEFDTNSWTLKPSADDSDLNNEIKINLLKVVPLTTKDDDDDCENSKEMSVIPLKSKLEDTYKDYSKEMAVVPLQYNKTNSTEVDNILDKRDKRTSRKTDRLNQTTATIPKTGREGKGGRRQQSSTGDDSETDGKDLADGGSAQNTTEKGKKGRPKSPCEPIESEPYVNIEIVKYGRDPNNTFSSGTIVRVACGKGYGLNLEANATAKCVRGRWKPEKPKCEILPCHVPSTEYGIYTMSADAGHPMTASQVLGSNLQDEKELNETDPVPNGQVVHFSCEYGYNVQGPTNLRCWLGEWAVTSTPECVAAPCELPLLHGATYEAGYRAGLTVAHASSVNIACEPGRSPPATLNCHLGRLQPTVHDFCRPLANLTRPRPTSEYQSGSDIVREDISQLEPDIDSTTNTDCGPPARVQGTLIYRDGAEMNSSLGVEGYPHGTEITFRCIASIMGEKTTWKLICEQGNWVGKSFNCEELEAQNEELQNNNSCTFENDELNVVAFYNDMQITEVVDFPAGAMITSRCSDIGKYAMSGSQTRKCVGGSWDGVKPSCFGLNQQMDYAMEKRPTILFRHSQGPIAQTNDGKLLVYPGTVLHMECLWMRRFGNPKWNVTLNNPESDRKYIEGWTTDPGRDSALEYRLSIINAVKEDSGIYRCETPARQSHQVEIIVEDVHCPPLPIRRGLVASGLGTRLGTEIRFHCANGNALLGAHTLLCRASGNWSSPLPVCESVECGEVVHDTPLGEGERRPRVAVVSRGVGGRAAFSCSPGWALRGAPETVCLPAADWAKPFPVCREVSCPALPPPTSGYVLGRAPYRAGDVLQFHCNPEHTLHGRPILVCQDSGRWSDKPPTCAQACTYPGTTISGRMSSVKFYYKIGETITFTCEPGYRLKGAPMLRCLKTDRKYIEGWTTDPGRDSALEYRLSIINAVKEDSGIYRCETPARQSHQVEIIVEDVHCPPLPIRRGLVASGLGTRLGTEIRFHCANGNALLGAHTLLCRASGNWSSPLPVCESVECGEVVHDTPLGEGERRPRVAVVSRGVGGRAAFSCSPGWALRGAPETVCLPAADWAKPFPVCREVSCPALPPPTSGYVLGRAPYRAGDVLQFHCNPEHTLHGRPILVCQDSGRWSDKPPTCAQACTYPGTTISGRMSSVKFYYKIGETITFTCEPGYRLKGAPMLRCLKTDRKYIEGWTTDPGRDSALEYRLSIINAVKEDSGIYRCETPARQSHQVEIIVEDVHCPPLPIRRGLVASGLGTRLGTEIRFHCANGNALLGAHTLLCRASGNWSSPLPVCESVECGEVVHDTPLGEGERRPRVAVVSRGVGGRAAFSCSPGWALRGAPETVCLPAADWAKPFPVCREVSCPALPPPTSGYVLGRAPYRAGDVLQFHCNPEHTLHGRPILVCQDSGRWSDKPPTCAQACTYPGTTISGRMSSVKFYYKIGETITFTCEPGYRLKGAPMLRCLKNRKWSNAIPLCTPNTNYTSSDTVAMFNGDIDAMLSDAPADILKTREAPAILSPESYKAAVTRAAVSRLLRRGPIENYRNRVYRVNRLLRRDTER